MHYFNVFRYPLFTMITNELDQMKFSCSPQSLIPVFVGAGNVACPTVPDFSNGYCWQSVCPLQNGNQLLNVFSIDVSQLQMNGGLMVVMWVGFRLLGFLAFRYVNHIKR
jgi:hypothetical protein